MKLREDEVLVPASGCEIRSVVISPVGEGPWPGVLLYTDIFQLTDSTLRTARRLASAGFVVCVPEIYPRGALAGVALEFDDAGKQAGLAARPAPRPRSSTRTALRCWTSWSSAPTSRPCSRWGSASAVTSRSGPRSTRGSRPPCASIRPGCTTVRWEPMPTRARSPGPAVSTAG